ncbi:hypothetical protein H5410_037780 [Solanum commersonii]|uniref:Uncharacterized protein n=1 Tax=Solanum commersonii TaxID=4109 RepID=A0A9J5YB75_SOLCO|nr:hypothetical protein H5410_037780 [Solanum commersonii]
MTTKSPSQPPTRVDLDLKEREPTSRIVWEEEEVERMIMKENLEIVKQYAYSDKGIVLGGLRESIIKAGLLHIASWVDISNANVEVGANEVVFSLAAAVGKPLQVDLATRNQTRPSCARVKVENCKIQGHDEEQCYVLHPDLYPKEKVGKEEEMETGEEKREIQGKGREKKVKNLRFIVIEGEQEGVDRGGGKPEQIWHKKKIQHEKEGITTGNKFGALKDQDECRETQGGQKEKGEVETKKWVEEVFQKTTRIDKGNSLKNIVESINRVDEEKTAGSESFKNSGNIEVSGKQKCSEQDARSSNMGNTCLEMVEFHEVQDNDEVLPENQRRENRIQEDDFPDLQELTLEESKKRRDKEEDNNFNENIDKVVRDGDLSPRQIKLLESEAKRSKSTIFWNIRSVKSQKDFERLTGLNRRHKYNFIALMEPFQDPKELDHYKRKLEFKNAYCNVFAKNWIFWDDGWRGEVVSDSIQQISLKLSKNNVEMICTAVYLGDFNVILNEEERLGGLDFTQFEALDFSQCINNCALTELKFVGSMFTWWNGRIERDSIFKRLDRVFGNQEFNNMLPTSEVHHLVRQGSDHAPLHVICNSKEEVTSKPLKFLNFWTRHPQFQQLIENNWRIDFKVETSEDEVKVMKIQLEITKNEENRADF